MKILVAVTIYIFCSHAAFAVSQLEIDDQLVIDAMWSPQADRVAPESSLEKELVLELGEPLVAEDQATLNADFEDDEVSWRQQGLLVTERNFDLAIAGQGFFWLINGTTGANRVTRDGRFKIDINGNLVHWEHGDQVLKKTETGISNIRITDAARIVDITTGEEATITSIWATEDGIIHARYSNGEIRDTCQLAVMDFDRPRDLTRVGQHLFEYDDSNLPKDSESSRVFGNSSEGLDEEAYMSMGFLRWQSYSTFDKPHSDSLMKTVGAGQIEFSPHTDPVEMIDRGMQSETDRSLFRSVWPALQKARFELQKADDQCPSVVPPLGQNVGFPIPAQNIPRAKMTFFGVAIWYI